MRLSEIAEYIVEHRSDCCMAVNHDVIKGCREDWYEEYLINPLMDYYMYEELNLCGCGSPEFTYSAIREYLHIREDWYKNRIKYDGVLQRYKKNLHIDDNDSLQSGLLQFMMYILDHKGFTEHGGSIGGCWITDKGRRLLTVLDAWNDASSNEDEL